MIKVASFQAENDLGEAVVLRDGDKFCVQYFDEKNTLALTEEYESQRIAEEKASDWANGRKVLYG